MSPSRENLCSLTLLGLALAVGFLLQFPWHREPLEIDEHVSYWIAVSHRTEDNSFSNVIDRSLSVSATPPLSFLLQHATTQAVGDTPTSLRIPSMAGYLLAILLTCLAARMVLGRIPAGLAALLLALHPEVVDRVRLARPYGAGLLFSSALLCSTIIWGKRTLATWRLIDTATVIAWTLSAIALIWTHYLNAPAVPVSILLWSILRTQHGGPTREESLAMLGCLGIIGMTSLPLLTPVLRLATLSDFLNYRHQAPGLLEGLGTPWLIAGPILFLGFLTATSVGQAGQTPSPSPDHPLPAEQPATGTFFICAFLPVFAYWLAARWGIATLGEPRYRVVFSPWCCLFLASLIPRKLPVTAALTLTLGAWMTAWCFSPGSPQTPWKSKELGTPAAQDWRSMAAVVHEQSAPEDLLLVYGGLVESRLVQSFYEDEQFMDYVACRLGGPELAAPHRRLALPGPWIPDHNFDNWLLQQFNSVPEGGSIWIAVSTDTDIGQTTLQRAELLCQQAGLKESIRQTLRTATLAEFSKQSAHSE